jgi:lipopolysaccharide export system protein LptA
MCCRRASALVALALMTASAQAQESPPAVVEAPSESVATAAAEAPTKPADPIDFRAKVYEYRSAGSEFRRPSGEITVTADRTEWQQSGITRCTGNVRLTSDTMELRGDVLELKQFDDGRLSHAHVTGEPAQMSDAAGDNAPPITAHAKKLDYDARTNLVELSGGAVLTRGADKITGESIRYDVAQRRVQASGGNAGQVKIVIQPPKEKAP